MTGQDIIDEVRGIVQETDPDNSHFTDSWLLTLIRDAVLDLYASTNSLPIITTTVDIAETLTLDKDTLYVLSAKLINDTDSKYEPLILIDFPSFNDMVPNWEETASGKPTHLVRLSDQQWRLYPSPDTTWTARDMVIYSSERPAVISTSAEPQISPVLHQAIVFYVAWKTWIKLRNLEEGLASFEAYNSFKKQYLPIAIRTRGVKNKINISGVL